jgi:hypothetical protein
MNNPQQNADHIDAFSRYIAERKPMLKQQYEQRLAHDLSRQQWQGCFERNVLAVLTAFYDDAFYQLHATPFETRQYPVKNGMSELTRQLLATFQGFIDEFLLFVVDKHRTSCALSNFPDEHLPDKDYVNDVKREVAELWRTFALKLNTHFLDRI